MPRCVDHRKLPFLRKIDRSGSGRSERTPRRSRHEAWRDIDISLMAGAADASRLLAV
jgi:hypothetical protein